MAPKKTSKKKSPGKAAKQASSARKPQLPQKNKKKKGPPSPPSPVTGRTTYTNITPADRTLDSAITAIRSALETRASDIFQGDNTVTIILSEGG
jgi:hypothetical protein